MSAKVDRAVYGPAWTEVIVGAVLSLILGLVLGAVLLVIKPVVSVKEPPKERAADTVYFVEGLRGDSAKARQALAKRKAFVDGQSVSVTEDEINSLASATNQPAPSPKGTAAPKSNDTIATGTPNVRIRDGVLQVGVPISVNVFGFEQKVIAQARGGFEKHGDVFAYEPSEIYFGSCPVQAFPFLSSYVRSKVIESQKVPDDIAQAWPKLSNVAIEGNSLKLTMP